jgi:hypothetical protein
LPLRDSTDSNNAPSVRSTQSTSTVDEPMDLLTASFNTKQSLEKPRWISSTVRILQDQSSGNFRVLISQEDSLLSEIIGNRQPLVCVCVSVVTEIDSRP